MSDSITNFAVQYLQEVVQKSNDDEVRVGAIQTLLSLREQNKKKVNTWYNVPIRDMMYFMLKLVVAAIPSAFAVVALYLWSIILVNVASQLFL